MAEGSSADSAIESGLAVHPSEPSGIAIAAMQPKYLNFISLLPPHLWVVNTVAEKAPVFKLCGMVRVSGQSDRDGFLPKLGDAIRSCRNERGMSQEALADDAAIDRSHLGKIERGERNVTLLNVLKIARALDTTASELLSRAGL